MQPRLLQHIRYHAYDYTYWRPAALLGMRKQARPRPPVMRPPGPWRRIATP